MQNFFDLLIFKNPKMQKKINNLFEKEFNKIKI